MEHYKTDLKSTIDFIIDDGSHVPSHQKKSFTRKEYTKNMEKDLELSAKLIHILKIDRATEFSDWFKVGCALYNVSEGTQDGYELFLEFSQRCSEKYDEDSCFEKWEKMEIRDEGLNIGSLRKWAKEDNPESYNDVCFDKGKIDFLIEECLTGSHGNMAKLFRFVYGLRARLSWNQSVFSPWRRKWGSP